MITLTRPAYYSNFRNNQYCGLKKDDKSTISASNGDEYYEIDTAKFFRYNEASNEWIEQPSDAAPIDTGLPPMTSETTGHFLSNDGSVTKWQPVASKNFIIGLTANNDGSYTSDKTFVQIKTAYDEFQNIVIRYDSAQMPLMNVEFASNGDAMFLFGHVEIQTDGQRIVTRAIQYSHTNSIDTWMDFDKETDLSQYLLLSGGHMEGALTLAGNPTEDNHAANKKYVDSRNLEVRFTQDATAGIKTTTEIGEITQAVIANRTVTAILDGDTYMLISASAADASFGRVEGNIITVLRYNPNNGGAWAKEQTSLLELKGGTMTGNINMGSNAITNVQKIYVDGQANLYLGSVVEKAGTNGVRLTGTTSNEAAFVKPTSQNEYVPVLVGNPTAPNHAVNLRHLTEPILSDAPASDECISNKKYVDDQVAMRVPLQTANQGQIKAYVQNGSKPDVCLVSDGGMALCLARYTAKGHLIDQTAPTENNHLANKQYVDTKVAQTGGNISGDLMVGGSLTINGIGSMMGTPTQDVDLVNKGYLDSSMSDIVRKSSVTVGANSSVNVSLSNGAYLLTVSDDMHGGLVFVSVYPSGETINGLVNLNNWKCERINSGSGVTLTNSAASAMTVYITSIEEGTYR